MSQQRAMPQRARTEFAAALEPGDDAVVGKFLGYRVGDVGGSVERHVGGSQGRLQLLVGPFPAEIGARKRRMASPCRCARYRAPPSAVPASPAAG